MRIQWRRSHRSERPVYLDLTGLLSAAIGFGLAVFLMIGRWDFGRLLGAAPGTTSMLFQPRTFVAIALILVSLALLSIARNRQPSTIGTWISVLLLIAMSALITSVAWAPDTSLAINKVGELLLAASAHFAAYVGLTRGESRRVFSTFFVSLAVLAAPLILGGVVSLGDRRLTALGGGPNALARILGIALLAFLALATRRPVTGNILAGVCAVLVLMTGSRGGLLATMLGFVSYLAAARMLRLKSLFPIFAVPTIGVIVFVLVLPDSARSLVDRWEQRFIRTTFQTTPSFEIGGIGVYASQREVPYEFASRMIEKDFPLGSGIASFPALYGGGYPHNYFLELLAEGGLVPVLAVVLSFGIASIAALRSRSRTVAAAFGMFVVCLVAAQVSGDVFDNRGVSLMALMTATGASVLRDPLFRRGSVS